jgi:hypothetical protein
LKKNPTNTYKNLAVKAQWVIKVISE